MDIILLAGLWLESSAWDHVASDLRALGHHPMPVALPGADDGSAAATLEDQVSAALAALDAADRPMLVGHSAACTLAWIAADRRPDSIHTAVLVGGFPSSDGERYADLFETVGGVMPFPGWEPFDGPDSSDLDAATRQRLATGAVPVPEGVATGIVRLEDERRHDVPVVIVCPEFSPEDARGWIDGGQVPELARTRNVSFVDIDSGHWPMFTQPAELARVFDAIATRS